MTENVTAVATKIDWSSLSGLVLDGGYELKDVLDAREDAAKLRVRILGSGGKTGQAYFLRLEAAEADDQLDIWNTLREAPHANLSRPVALGRRDISGFQTVFLVLADADEKLAAVVPERPLEWEEAAEVLHSCEKGLAHLHAHGLIHGSMSPQTVEAVGYSVQLNTASVRRLGKKPRVEWEKPAYLAPESKETNLTTAADVWCLGATLFEVLVQHPYGTAGVELEKGLPLGAVIQRCLDKNPVTRCTLKEAPSVEQAQATAEVETPAMAKPVPIAPGPFRPEDYGAVPPPPPPPGPSARPASPAGSRMPQPLTPRQPPRQVTKEDMALVPMAKRHKKVKKQPVGARIRTLDESEQDSGTSESTGLVLAPAVSARILSLGNRPTLMRNVIASVGLAALFAAAVWFIIIPKLQSTEQPLTSTVSAQTTTDFDTRPSVPAPSIPVPQNSAAPAPAAPAPVPTQDETQLPHPKREFFRVAISYFPSRGEADHERDVLSQQHPELFLTVVRLPVESGQIMWVVSVGGTLGRDDAEPLLQRTLAKGIKTAHLLRIELNKR